MSGISSEIFKQLETVENDHDASTAAALEVSKNIDNFQSSGQEKNTEK